MSLEFLQYLNVFQNYYTTTAFLGGLAFFAVFFFVRSDRGVSAAYRLLNVKYGKKDFQAQVRQWSWFAFILAVLALTYAFLSNAIETIANSPSLVRNRPVDLDPRIRNVVWRPLSYMPLEFNNNAYPDCELWKNETRPWGELTQSQQKTALKAVEKMAELNQVDYTFDENQESGFIEWGEHFSFELRKGTAVTKMHLQDVIIEVVKFHPLPPRYRIGMVPREKPIIVVPIKQLNMPLPWTFHAKWISKDFKLAPFRIQEIALTEQGHEGFMVKVAGIDPGIYVYRIRVVVQSDDEETKTLLITTQDKQCAFQPAVSHKPLSE